MIATKYIFGRKYKNLNDSLVAYYAFEGNNTDQINANNGTSVGAITYPSGVVGLMASSFAASRYITLPQSTNLDFSDSSTDLPFSISFWYSKVDAANRCLFSKRGGTSANDQWQINMTTSLLDIALYSNSTSAYISKRMSGVTIANGVLNHYVVTYDGSGSSSGIKMYFNGSETTTTTTNVGSYTKMPQASQLTYIGRLWNGTQTLAGSIDEFGVWKNRVLSASDVSSLYNSGSGKTYPF